MAETTNTQNFAGNLDFSALQKKKYTIDGNPDKVIELNPSDFSILTRFNEVYPQLQDVAKNCGNIFDGIDLKDDSIFLEELNKASDRINDADGEIRKLVDYIFDYPVCNVCFPSGCMYDLINGKFVFEHIIDTLLELYQVGINEEVKKAEKRMKEHTNKYTK